MRIAMIGPFGLRPKGTMAVRAMRLARELATQGHAITIIMPPWQTPEEAGRVWVEAGIRLEYVALGPQLAGRPWPLLGEACIALRLVRRALAWGPDAIHCFKPKAYAGLAGWLLWHLRRLGLIRARLVMDEDDWEGYGGWNDREPYGPLLKALFAWQENWGLRHNDAVTVASLTLQSLVWSLGVPPARVHYLPNGAEVTAQGDGSPVRARYALHAAPLVLLYTRFFEYDVARVVAVWREVVAAVPAARLMVVGTALFPADDLRFDRLLAETGLAGSVIRAGWVPAQGAQPVLSDYLAAADVAIFPFDDTLINRVKCAVRLVDLLAAGVPVVADAVGQNTEYLQHGESGWLVPPGDTAAMAAAVINLLHDAPLRHRLGSAAAAHIAEHYTWRLLASRALAAYTVQG
jgi:glycosyltransferase involved in cell wall biosynthesis